MTCLILLTASMFNLVLSKAAIDHYNNKNKNLIMHSHSASIRDFPYSAYLSRNCGGNFTDCCASIVTKFVLLTAAHCVTCDTKAIITVRVGSNFTHRGGTVYEVDKIRININYESETIVNDIAMIKVSKPIEFNSDVRNVVLKDYFPPSTEMLRLAGWGDIDTNHNRAGFLKMTTVYAKTAEECRKYLKQSKIDKKYNNGIFCGQGGTMEEIEKYPDKHGRPYYGDSGCALIAWDFTHRELSKKVFHQVGLLSHIVMGSSFDIHGISQYANVTYHYDWIQKKIKDLEKGTKTLSAKDNVQCALAS